MPEMPDVVSGENVESAWGNDIRDRTLQRYADSTERDTLVPLPIAGDMAWLDAEGQMTVYTGAAWVAVIDPDVPQIVQVNRRTVESASISADTTGSVVVDLSALGIVNANRCTANVIGSGANQQSQRGVWNYDQFSATEIRVWVTGGSSQTNTGGAFGQLIIVEYDRQVN